MYRDCSAIIKNANKNNVKLKRKAIKTQNTKSMITFC